MRTISLMLALGASAAWGAPAERAALLAQQHVGVPYHWGGATPQGFDCSGLVHYVYARAGVELPRTVDHQRASTRPIPVGQLRRGDLLFFQLPRRSRLHVGIYLGNGRFIHAPSRGKQVAYADLHTRYWQTHFTGAGRIVKAR